MSYWGNGIFHADKLLGALTAAPMCTGKFKVEMSVSVNRTLNLGIFFIYLSKNLEIH